MGVGPSGNRHDGHARQRLLPETESLPFLMFVVKFTSYAFRRSYLYNLDKKVKNNLENLRANFSLSLDNSLRLICRCRRVDSRPIFCQVSLLVDEFAFPSAQAS